MALRVLLADESSTIKKVMQLALADYAVEVKAVPVGLDVVAVAKTFKPDIIFADVLLTKISGYEVCTELKQDAETKHIPVVLMWSGFMEIDEAKAAQSQANARLEKPFDADYLRKLVEGLVKKTQTNPVSSFLTFPSMPEFDERPSEHSLSKSSEIYSIPDENSQVFTHNTVIEETHFKPIEESSVEENPLEENPDEEFAAVPLTAPKAPIESEEEGDWAHQDLTKFKIKLPAENEDDFASKFVIPQDELTKARVEVSGEFEEISFGTPAPSAPTQATGIPAEAAKNQQKMDIAPDMMEKILREEARGVMESICWKILPEIAERVVREEINKILRESEKNI